MRIATLAKAWSLLRVRELALARGRCALCDSDWQVRLSRSEIGVRCVRCGASAVTQSLVDVMCALRLPLAAVDACELSARGPLVAWLGARCRSLATSEYVEGARSGSSVAGVRCEDVQALSYADGSFDLVTSTEVFEHVPDDAAGFTEVRRVLRPGGYFLFTVPLCGAETVERVRRDAGNLHYKLPPEWHGDPRLGGRPVLAWRNYGADVIDRLLRAGFAEACLRSPVSDRWFGYARCVVVARR